MKKVIRIALFTAFIMHVSFSIIFCQKDQHEKDEIYNIWVTKLDKSSKSKGYLFDTKDSLITILKYSAVGGYQNIAVSNIDEIKLRRKGVITKSALYGTLAGISIGVIIGYASGDFDAGIFSISAHEKATYLGILLSLPGAIIGSIVGRRMNVKIPIRGNQKTYDAQREKLKRYQMSF